MRTRLAHLLLAAARRLDPTLDTRPRRIAEVTPERIREVQDAINRTLRPSGGQILGPSSRQADSVPVKLSEGGRVCGTCWMPLERRAYEVPIDGRMEVLGVSPWHCPGGHDQPKPFPGA